MEIIDNKRDLINLVDNFKRDNLSIGFVPTMGYLHFGHKSLISNAIKENDKTIVSIFVNPLQFGKDEDLDKYPRDFEADCELLNSIGVDVLFSPTPEEMYGETNLTTVYVNKLSKLLCGISRPVHFEGVTTIVTKLFNIVRPDRAYFGEKDFQQLTIIKKMVLDLDMQVEIRAVPTVREDSNLAMSSRNNYLSDSDKLRAVSISKAIFHAKNKILDDKNINRNQNININLILNRVKSDIELTGINIDYVNIVDFYTLEDIETIKENHKKIVILVAVYLDNRRLIDNVIIDLT